MQEDPRKERGHHGDQERDGNSVRKTQILQGEVQTVNAKKAQDPSEHQKHPLVPGPPGSMIHRPRRDHVNQAKHVGDTHSDEQDLHRVDGLILVLWVCLQQLASDDHDGVEKLSHQEKQHPQIREHGGSVEVVGSFF